MWLSLREQALLSLLPHPGEHPDKFQVRLLNVGEVLPFHGRHVAHTGPASAWLWERKRIDVLELILQGMLYRLFGFGIVSGKFCSDPPRRQPILRSQHRG